MINCKEVDDLGKKLYSDIKKLRDSILAHPKLNDKSKEAAWQLYILDSNRLLITHTEHLAFLGLSIKEK